MTGDTMTLALWATDLSPPVTGIADWVGHVDARLGEAAEAGARLMVMPEYVAEQWLSFKPAGLSPRAEIAWMAEQAPQAVSLLRRKAADRGVALLAGTMPWQVDGGFRNRAWLFLPDGREIAQDKLVLTPGERDPESWHVTTGDTVEIVEWAGLRIATLVCLDIEMPALAARLAREAIDLVLVPSSTGQYSGYYRVFGCAKARAVELLTVVAATGGIGMATGTTQNPTNVSGCAVYLPCEPGLGHDGIHAGVGPLESDPEGGPLLIARDIPFATIRALRAGGAQVWPGAWDASKIRISRS
jgi:predicted amidohydrolase